MNQFNLEKQYQLYLERVNMDEDRMHPVQRTETRRAFMGACGQLLMLIMNDLQDIDDDKDRMDQMKDMINQVQSFWLNETNQND